MSEDFELLKAAIAVAVADGKVLRSEMGVVKGLAKRAGVGQATYEAILESASRDEFFADSVFLRSKEKARSAVELLVAEARIDGEISDQERDVIVRIASSVGIRGDEFRSAYEAGLARADEIRSRRARGT